MSLEMAILVISVCYGVAVTILYSGAWLTVQIIKKQHRNQVKKVNATIQQSNAQMKTMVGRLQGCLTLEDVDKVLANYSIVRMRKEKI